MEQEKKALDNISLEINKGENDCINRFSCQRNTLCPEVGVHGCFAARCKRCPEGIICSSICDNYDSFQCDLLDKPPYVCSNCKMQKEQSLLLCTQGECGSSQIHQGCPQWCSSKKVVYRQRRPKRVLTKLEYQYRQGHTIEDFNSFVEANPDVSIVEMDTVKGSRERGKVFLTMIFRKTSFMAKHLLI